MSFYPKFDPKDKPYLWDIIEAYEKSRMNIFGKLPDSTAGQWSLDYVDLLKALRMGVMAALATAAVVFIDSLSKSVLGLDFGAYNALAVPLLTMGFEALRRMAVDYSVRPQG